ncbi:MAG: Zn-ribbon containing protein [Candidatus Pacearchaeota archaeon]
MPHQCVRCSNIIKPGSREILEGCKNCGGRFFFYLREDQIEKAKQKLIEIPEKEKKIVEKDIREMVGIVDDEAPVILDIESIRVKGEGKFEIDLIKIFRKNTPIVYKLEDGKYIIDLASTLGKSAKDIKEIKNPDLKRS